MRHAPACQKRKTGASFHLLGNHPGNFDDDFDDLDFRSADLIGDLVNCPSNRNFF
jgi:hypothetical protein